MISARERRESRTILRGMATTVSNGHMVFDGVAPHHEDDTGEWFEGNFKPSDSATTTSNVKHCPFAIWLFTPDGKKVFQDKHNDNACTSRTSTSPTRTTPRRRTAITTPTDLWRAGHHEKARMRPAARVPFRTRACAPYEPVQITELL